MKRMIAGLALALLGSGAQSAPQVSLGSLYDYLNGNSSTQLKRVRNTGDSTAFVKVSVVELVYDAHGKVLEVSHEGSGAAERPLIASPARLIVPANGMQAVRLLYRGDRDRERYFRLRFIPVLPERDDGFAVSPEEAERYGTELNAGVNILTGYGSLMFVRPQQVRYQTDIDERDSAFTVRNQGNSTVVLDHFNDCERGGRQCSTATKHHIRPGVEREFSRVPGRVHRFELIEGEARRRVEIKG